MSAQKNAGIAHVDVIFNSVVIFPLGTHLSFPQNKSKRRFPTKQLKESCDFPGNECFQKRCSLYGVYINLCKLYSISFSSDLPADSGPDRFTVPLNPKIPLIRSTSLLLKVRYSVPLPKTAMIWSPRPKPDMITMIPMMSKTNMNRSPVPRLKPDMISIINMNPTNNMETTYDDKSISICNQKKEKNLKSEKPIKTKNHKNLKNYHEIQHQNKIL